MVRGEIGNASTIQMDLSRPEGKEVVPSNLRKKMNNYIWKLVF